MWMETLESELEKKVWKLWAWCKLTQLLICLLCMWVLAHGRSWTFTFVMPGIPSNISNLQLIYCHQTYHSASMVICQILCPGSILIRINVEPNFQQVENCIGTSQRNKVSSVLRWKLIISTPAISIVCIIRRLPLGPVWNVHSSMEKTAQWFSQTDCLNRISSLHSKYLCSCEEAFVR